MDRKSGGSARTDRTSIHLWPSSLDRSQCNDQLLSKGNVEKCVIDKRLQRWSVFSASGKVSREEHSRDDSSVHLACLGGGIRSFLLFFDQPTLGNLTLAGTSKNATYTFLRNWWHHYDMRHRIWQLCSWKFSPKFEQLNLQVAFKWNNSENLLFFSLGLLDFSQVLSEFPLRKCIFLSWRHKRKWD